jgi:acyl-homoserine-lactone acylase
VFNANDSHWLANPDELLTGYSPLTGPEAVPQSARTRMNAVLLADPAMRGDDGLFDLAELEAAILSQRGVHAELLLDQVLTACARTPLVLVDGRPYLITPACDVLRAWDRTYHVQSRGAALWREYLTLFDSTDLNDAGALYRVGFDPNDPVYTPNTLNDDVDVEVLQNLGIAAKQMIADGWALDGALGDMQRDGRVGDSGIPLGGGTYVDGTASIVDCCSGSNTLAPSGEPGTFSATQSYSDRGYPVTDGNSFMMVMEFAPDGPHARAVLTYGQPDGPDDPGFTSQTQLYSDNTFRPVLFTPDEIAADPDAMTTEVSAPDLRITDRRGFPRSRGR